MVLHFSMTSNIAIPQSSGHIVPCDYVRMKTGDSSVHRPQRGMILYV